MQTQSYVNATEREAAGRRATEWSEVGRGYAMTPACAVDAGQLMSGMVRPLITVDVVPSQSEVTFSVADGC